MVIKKRRSFLIASILILLSSTYSQKKPNSINPKNTILAFDLHGVLFKINYNKIVSIIFKSGKIWKLISALFDKSILRDIRALKAKHSSSEQYVHELIKKYPKLKSIENLGIEIINAQKPITKTIKIIENLKKQGYKIYLISNIGPKSLELLKTRHPDIIGLFDSFSTPTVENNWLRKPNRTVFDNFITKNKLKNKNIIFIDDKQKHLNSANTAGIQNTILFKTASKLKKDIQKLGINFNITPISSAEATVTQPV